MTVDVTEIGELIVPPIHPKFVAWLAEQPAATLDAIKAKWAETGSHGDIAPGPIGTGARKYRVLEFCAQTFGYDFTP